MILGQRFRFRVDRKPFVVETVHEERLITVPPAVLIAVDFDRLDFVSIDAFSAEFFCQCQGRFAEESRFVSEIFHLLIEEWFIDEPRFGCQQLDSCEGKLRVCTLLRMLNGIVVRCLKNEQWCI